MILFTLITPVSWFYVVSGIIAYALLGSVMLRALFRLRDRRDRRALREFLRAVALWFVAFAFLATTLAVVFYLSPNIIRVTSAIAYASLAAAAVIYRQEDDGDR